MYVLVTETRTIQMLYTFYVYWAYLHASKVWFNIASCLTHSLRWTWLHRQYEKIIWWKGKSPWSIACIVKLQLKLKTLNLNVQHPRWERAKNKNKNHYPIKHCYRWWNLNYILSSVTIILTCRYCCITGTFTKQMNAALIVILYNGRVLYMQYVYIFV